jgi:hypothetical protein
MKDDETTNNLLLNITINILIVSAASYLVSQKMQSTQLPIYMGGYYKYSLILLLFCYVFVQFDNDSHDKEEVIRGHEKEKVISGLHRMLPYNLLITNFGSSLFLMDKMLFQFTRIGFCDDIHTKQRRALIFY